MTNKVYGFNMKKETRVAMQAKLDAEKKSGNLPPAASASYIVNQLVDKWNTGEVKVP